MRITSSVVSTAPFARRLVVESSRVPGTAVGNGSRTNSFRLDVRLMMWMVRLSDHVAIGGDLATDDDSPSPDAALDHECDPTRRSPGRW